MTRLVRLGGIMVISVYEAKTNFSKLIQTLIDGNEEIIIISKNGKPVVQMSLLAKKNSKRVGSARKEMKDFDISLEDFNSIPIEDFGL